MEKSEYFEGAWTDEILADVAKALLQEGNFSLKAALSIEFKNHKELTQDQKVIMFGFGDRHVRLLHANKDHIVMLSVDSTIEVLVVISRKRGEIVFQDESY